MGAFVQLLSEMGHPFLCWKGEVGLGSSGVCSGVGEGGRAREISFWSPIICW